ncbi:hypothetical protein Sjap_022950 [Stephania japonica]|uniref:Choline monooxygenase, chloroplastic n=1 Tax=Stephania japonica TaxID=461633 RepID=A0AAP0HQC8_9MAGN
MEDIVLCEGVQKGLESAAYRSGRYAPTVEKAMHHFHSLLHESLSLPVDQRAIAADCMSYEAERRVEDPVYDCVKIIYGLQKKKNEIELELAKARSEIVFHSAVICGPTPWYSHQFSDVDAEGRRRILHCVAVSVHSVADEVETRVFGLLVQRLN